MVKNSNGMFDVIHDSVQSLGGFSEHELAIFSKKLKVVHLSKDACLLREGEVCRTVYFVNWGSLRQFRVDDDTDEITLNFFVEKDWVLDYQSFTSQKPARAMIQATEECEVLQLSLHDLHALIEESGSFFRLGRLLEHGLASQEYRTGTMSPEEKYRLLLSTKPRIIQKFPLKHIASYLNITPETLSRVRKKLSRSPDFLI